MGEIATAAVAAGTASQAVDGLGDFNCAVEDLKADAFFIGEVGSSSAWGAACRVLL